jgi:hypothetical protein
MRWKTYNRLDEKTQAYEQAAEDALLWRVRRWLFPSHTHSISTRRTDRARRPAAPPSCQPIIRCLPLKIGGRFDEVCSSHVVKGVYVDYCVLRPIDHACSDWHYAARQANVKIGGSRPKPISLHLGVVGDVEMKAATRM